MGDIRLRVRLFPLNSGLKRFVHRIRGKRIKVLHVVKRCHHQRKTGLGAREQRGKSGSYREGAPRAKGIVGNDCFLCFVYVRVYCG